MFKIQTALTYRKHRKKLKSSDRDLLDEVVHRLANDEKLEVKYKDHKLNGDFKDYRECHIKPDLLLIYQKRNDILVLVCVDVGSHSEMFR